MTNHLSFSVANPSIIQSLWYADPGEQPSKWQQVALLWLKTWTWHFQITDRSGWTATRNIKVNVVPTDTTNVEGECELDIRWHCRILLRGTWEYTASVSNGWVVSISMYSDAFYIYANASWTTKVFIKKNWVIVHTIAVNVTEIRTLNVSFPLSQIEVWDEHYFYARWNGWYRLIKNNENVSIYATSDPEKYIIEWRKNWTTTVTVLDSQNKTDSFTVSVTGWVVESGEWGVVDSEDLSALIDELWLFDSEFTVANTDWVEVNSYREIKHLAFYSLREFYINKFSLNVQRNLNSFATNIKDENKYSKGKLNKFISTLERVEWYQKFSTDEYQNLIKALKYSIKMELEWREIEVTIQEEEARQELFNYYASEWLDLTWFPAIWGWIASVTAFWYAEIINDPYLSSVAKDNLNSDLWEVAEAWNPFRKFKKLKEFWWKIKPIASAKKSIKTYEKLIADHKKNIQMMKDWKYYIDPAKVKGDIDLYKKWLISHWEKEINTFSNNILKEKQILNNIFNQ